MNKLSQGDRSRALGVLRDALQGVPDMWCDPEPDGDADAEISRKGGPTIRVRLRPWSEEGALEPDEVWLVRTASVAQQQRLRERGENFIALNGAVRLVQDWLVLDRTGLPSAKHPVTFVRRADPFSDRNSLIARTLLAHPGRTWGVRELASHAGVSLGTASQVIRALVGMGAIEQKQQGRAARIRLTDAGLLLRPWFAAYTWE
ncbi:MAG TPA: helix-turn-helix domain-containing protein, partial [Longimicrobium sp.]|nr:helix-turn-helix domain-containing protein [Longimicrobium sp.]